jgi:hypothetical protein
MGKNNHTDDVVTTDDLGRSHEVCSPFSASDFFELQIKAMEILNKLLEMEQKRLAHELHRYAARGLAEKNKR